MAEEPDNPRRIDWTETFPFVRLFSTFKRAASFWPMVLAFCCVALSYGLGRVMDAAWKASDAGVMVALSDETPTLLSGDVSKPAARFRFAGMRQLAADNEIEAYAMFDASLFKTWTRAAENGPGGPFISLLRYEERCFAASIQGVCAGRWGMSGSALSAQPAMIGSIFSAGNGVLWLITQRPCFATIFIIGLLIIFSFFGGAICRITAVRITRDERLPIKAAIDFARRKFAAFVAAPLLPIGMLAVAWVLIYVGGLVAAIPFLEILAGLFYGLTLIGGVVMAATLLSVVLGFHLMWPVVAVEASDAFDAVQRSAGYLVSRAWHVAFYSFVLLLYGAVSFVMVRIIAMLAFKLTHVASGAGMNIVSSAKDEAIGKLDAMWSMPAWSDLPLLPATGDVNFWGSFGGASLSGSEWFASGVIAFWVFIAVGLVGAFVVSFYFAGSTQMYLLLRRDVDAVDYDEIYYEEDEEDAGDEAADDAEEATSDGAETTGDDSASE